MAFVFVPVQPAEQKDLTDFLVRTFRADPSLASFRPDVMDWKYFADHPEWTQPRSWAVKQESQIVAHGGVWPVRLATQNGEIRAVHLIDWAASRSAVGVGVYLLGKFAGVADVLLTIGGSEDTRNLLPKLGYKQYGELTRYARVVRPWLQFRTTPRKNWKTPLKFLRNSVAAVRGIPHPPEDWQARKVSTFTGIKVRTASGTISVASSRRTPAGLNHLLRCPAASFSGFSVTRGQASHGYFALSKIGHQTRILDIWNEDGDQRSWNATGALAMHIAAQDHETCEIVAASSVEQVAEAWRNAGMVPRRTDPIFCYDPRDLLKPGTLLDLNLADGDQCFLSDPVAPYLC